MIAPYEDAVQACCSFPIGEVIMLAPLGNGHIHETWLVTTGTGKYVLQRLNPHIGVQETENVVLVTEHLASQGLLTPRLLIAQHRASVLENHTGTWRVMTYIEGSTIETGPTPAQAGSAARLLAQFHKALADIPGTLPYTLPHFHDTAYDLARLKEIHRPETSLNKYRECEPVARRVIELLEPRAHMLDTLPRRLIHADPKINNFRFDPESKEALCMLDLDTVGHHPLPIELGDMLRSCTAVAGGADIDTAVWRSIVETYRVTSSILTEEESRLIPDGYIVYALELAARSITDAYEEKFFRHDRDRFATLFEQNLARAELQLARAEGFLAHENDLRSL